MEELQNLTPLYNKEFYLAHLCGEDVELPIPDGNTEHYLAYLCGMDVPIPDPLYRKEFYLAYKCGQDVELPDPMYRIEYYLAKWCGIDCEVPEPMYRIEYWLAQLANSGELKTVSGNPISVSDALAKPAESLTIEILPQQSGSGDPSPDNVRPITGFTGVNIYRESAYDPDADPTYSISWQDSAGTVYGGSLGVTTGVLTVDRAIWTLDSTIPAGAAGLRNISTVAGFTQVEYYPYRAVGKVAGAIVSDKFAYANTVTSAYQTLTASGNVRLYFTFPAETNTDAAIRTWFTNNPTQVVYELATPLSIQLTPTEVQMLLGDNVIWNDVGDMTLEYLADGPADDADALMILLGNRYVNNGGADEATDREALEILLGGNTR